MFAVNYIFCCCFVVRFCVVDMVIIAGYLFKLGYVVLIVGVCCWCFALWCLIKEWVCWLRFGGCWFAYKLVKLFARWFGLEDCFLILIWVVWWVDVCFWLTLFVLGHRLAGLLLVGCRDWWLIRCICLLIAFMLYCWCLLVLLCLLMVFVLGESLLRSSGVLWVWILFCLICFALADCGCDCCCLDCLVCGFDF